MELKQRTPEEELIRANSAKQVLESEIFREACQRVEETLSGQRRSAPIHDPEMHTALIMTEQLWNNLKDWLQQVAQTGKFAEAELQRQRSLADRMIDTVRTWRRA